MTQSLRSISSSRRPLQRGEERLLGVLHHLRHLKETWEGKVSSESALKELQNEIEKIEKQIQEISATSLDKALSFSEAFKKSKSTFLAGGAIASIGIGAVLGANTEANNAAPLFYILGAGTGVAALMRTGGAVKESKETFNKSNQSIKDLNERLTKSRRLYSEQSKALRNNNLELPKVTFGTALLSFATIKTQNKSFLINKGNLIRPAQLQSVVLRDLSEESNAILRLTQKMDSIPVLLAPNEESINESRSNNSALHGEERSLKEAMSDYVQTLGSIGEQTLNIPAVRPESDLGKILGEVIAKNELIGKTTDENDIAIKLESNDSDFADNLKNFEKLSQETEAASESAIPQLEQINNELKELCNRYRQARTKSTNELHLSYQKVLNRANWSSKNFYCPRTILSKDYLQALIQLNLEEAHNASEDELIAALQSDDYISKRLQNKPQLIDDLTQSHSAVQELIHSYDLNPDKSGIVRTGAAGDHIVDQLKQELSLFRQRLIEALTGSPNGFLGISESARLYFDPERDLWSSPVLPYTYTTAEVEQYGQILRTDVELLIPLWEHLWTEKADFRKSELFRTNESIQRMSEKEGEKIKQLGYQFQNDLREVRSNMLLAKADFDSKLQELNEYEESIEDLGLMDIQQQKKLEAATMELEGASDISKSGSAEGYELIVMQEPTNQLLRRQSAVHDPIDVIKSPDLIIEGGRDKGIRRLNYVQELEEEE